MSTQLIKYMEIHSLSLKQDLEEIANKLDSLDPDSKDFRDLDFEYNWISGNLNATLHLLGVAQEQEGISSGD